MSPFIYLYCTTWKNRIKKALKKPVTYIYILLILLYIVFMAGSLGTLIEQLGIGNPEGMAMVFTVFTFVFIPLNMTSYAKRKGLIFSNADVHFMFPSPLSPKKALLYAHMRSILINLIAGILICIAGVIWFEISIPRILIYFVFAFFVEAILEGSMMLILYGSESLSEKQKDMIKILMYAIIACFILFGFYMVMTRKFDFTVIKDYLRSDLIQMIPVIGWNIAVIYLIFTGPTIINITCCVFYFILTGILLFSAIKMNCEGGFYEDAIKFAEDYAEARAKGRKGQIVIVGKKKKYQKARIEYKGKYAKAMFYRQMLEYKKNRFFFFGIQTLVNLAVAVFMYFILRDPDIAASSYRPYILPGIMAYVCFIFSGLPAKCHKELNMPYTYMIPDNAFRKLWYATLSEHLKSLVDGLILAIPGAIFLKLNFVQCVLSLAVYVFIQASKLYATLMMETLFGNVLGTSAKQIFRMLIMGIMIAFAVLAAILGNVFWGITQGYFAMVVVIALMNLIFGIVAMQLFEKMEAIE